MPKRNRTIFAPTPPVWKVRDIIEKLGGVGPMTEKLMAKGFMPPGADTVQGWATRNSVPGAWSPALFSLAQDAGLIETPMDALVRDFQVVEEGQAQMTNEEFMQRAQSQKADAEHVVDDWFKAAFLCVTLIAVGLVALVLGAFVILTVDVTPMGGIALLLTLILFNMSRK